MAKTTPRATRSTSETKDPAHVLDDSIMRTLLPKLRLCKADSQGSRICPELPSLVAKVCKEEGRGELWLGPLPTESRMEIITATKHSIQIYCFTKDPCSIR